MADIETYETDEMDVYLQVKMTKLQYLQVIYKNQLVGTWYRQQLRYKNILLL